MLVVESGTFLSGGLVGRVGELAVLRRAVELAFAGGVGLVIVRG